MNCLMSESLIFLSTDLLNTLIHSKTKSNATLPYTSYVKNSTPKEQYTHILFVKYVVSILLTTV